MNQNDLTPEMQQQVASTSRALGEALNRGTVKGTCIPNPPKKGELIRCQHCGEVMLPEHFSKNPIIRKREFKWQMHYFCQQSLLDVCDRQTTGLCSERKQKERINEERTRQ